MASPVQRGIPEIGSKEVGSTEVGTIEVGTIEVGTIEVGTIEVGTTEVGTTEVGSMEIGPTEVGIAEVGTTEVGTTEVGSMEVGTTEVGTTEVGTTEVGTMEVGTILDGIQQYRFDRSVTTVYSRFRPSVLDFYEHDLPPKNSSLKSIRPLKIQPIKFPGRDTGHSDLATSFDVFEARSRRTFGALSPSTT
jgi:hypothetical protein